MRRLIAYLTALILAVSCVTELEQGGTFVDGSLDGAPVTITFSVPDIPVLPASKAMEGKTGDITSTPYLDPDMMYLVVCGGTQSVKYIRKAEWLDTIDDYVVPENKYPLPEGDRHVTLHRFKVQLELSDSPRTVHILGNVDENQFITGSYAYNCLPNMLSYDNKQAYWQKIYVPHIKADIDQVTQKPKKNPDGSYVPDAESLSYFQDIPLIRNYAKIQVTNAAENFVLHSYAVIFAPEKGSVVPYRSNETVKENSFDFNPPSNYLLSGYEKTSFDQLESEINYLGNMPSSVALSKDIPAASEFVDPDNNSINGRVIRYNPEDTDQGFYIFERGIPNEKVGPTYIILCGKFESDDNWYYYRLDFMESKVEGTQTVSKYYPIYRNFRYNIQLHRISSEGVLTPEAAANSSGVEDISADFSMRHLTDISNGTTRLVVEPFMTRTYSGPSDDELNHYELYARFFNDVNSNVPNTETVAVKVELEPMTDGSDDILILYYDNGDRVPTKGFFFPEAATVGGVPGIRTIHFDTVEPLDETKTQKIKITGHNPGNHQDLRLYREVEITLQKKQPLEVTCTDPVQTTTGAPVIVDITIPAELPESMFPVEFIVEPEDRTLTPDTSKNINMPVVSGRSIAIEESATINKPAFYYIRTLTWEEFTSITPDGDKRTFKCFFKTNRDFNATTIWVYNEYFTKDKASFTNKLPLILSCDPVLEGIDKPITLALTIHSQIPEPYFPLKFIVEPEDLTITRDTSKDIDMSDVVTGRSIATGTATFIDTDASQFIRTLEWSEYLNLPEVGNQRTFYCYFKTTAVESATKIWAYNEHFSKASVVLENEQVLPDNHFWVESFSGTCSVRINESGLQYKKDNGTWNPYSKNAIVTLPEGARVSFKGGSKASKKTIGNGVFSCTGGQFKVGGNLASLNVGDDYPTAGASVKDVSFIDFFKAQTGLVDASELEMPMLILKENAYKSFFDSCTNLVHGPQSLPATGLGKTCYRNMFYNCSSLIDAPELPAATLVTGCYQRMFYGCSSLSSIKMLGGNWQSDAFISTESAVNPYSGNKTYKWCDGVAATGDIYLNASLDENAANWATTWGSVIPTGWTVHFE